MATYRGGEVPVPDYEEENLRLRGGRAPGMENVEEELGLPEDQRLDHMRKPGEKGYLKENMQIAGDGDAIYRRQPPPRQPFNPKGPGYDDETADWEGMQARINPEDNLPHGSSRVPRTGMLLKGREHPTFDKAVEEDRRLGYGLEMQDGRYYTQPFAKHEQGGMVEQPACKHGSSTIVQCSNKFR